MSSGCDPNENQGGEDERDGMNAQVGGNQSVDLDTGTLFGYLWDAANILRGPVDAADFRAP